MTSNNNPQSSLCLQTTCTIRGVSNKNLGAKQVTSMCWLSGFC